MRTIVRNEEARSILGVSGRAHNVVLWAGNGSAKAPHEIANQTWVSETRRWEEGRDKLAMRVTIRHDDNCKNGRPSFGITVDGYTNGHLDWGGASHDEIRMRFPELVPLLKWNLCATDGPMHYIANTCYHAGDLDHNGLRAGEARQIVNGKSGLPCWRLVVIGPDGKEVNVSAVTNGSAEGLQLPKLEHSLEWRPWNRIGDGKARDLDAARRAAVWADAPDEVLILDKHELAVRLKARLPALLSDFRHDVENICGMVWDAESANVKP